MRAVLLRPGARDQQDEVAAHPVGDVELAAVDPPVAVDPLGSRPDVGDVAPRVGLGDAERRDLLATDGGHEVALLLLLGPPLEDGRRGHLGVHADRHADAAGAAARHLLGEDDRAEVVAALTSVLLRVAQPEQAELAHAREDAVREALGRLPFIRVGAQLPGDEVAHRLAERVVLSREMHGRLPPWAHCIDLDVNSVTRPIAPEIDPRMVAMAQLRLCTPLSRGRGAAPAGVFRDGATTPPHRERRRPHPTPSPTPLPPDTLSVGVLGLGVGTFDLAAFPVARLKNEAKFHGAAVGGRAFRDPPRRQDPGLARLGGGEPRPRRDARRQRRLHRRLQRRHGVAATVVSAPGRRPPARLHHGLRRIHLPAVPPGPRLRQRQGDPDTVVRDLARRGVVGFAVCENSAGVILGGGSEQFVWQAGATLPADVPVVLNAAPASCSLGASTGW